MTPAELIALSRAVSDAKQAAARAALPAGTHLVDFEVRIRGALHVGTDTERIPTKSIPVLEVLALLVSRAGADRAEMLEAIRSAMADALERNQSGVGGVAGAEEIEQAWRDEVREMVRSLPPTRQRGAVRARLVVELLTPDPPPTGGGTAVVVELEAVPQGAQLRRAA